MLTSSDFVPESDVIENDFVMGGNEFGCEFAFDVVSIFEEFFSSMGEGKLDGF